ncbi:GNAT family N-acetyltransferase [Lactococcus lactis]|uniref:GNAT family N-acetyltransferase n=1 Tax=Lactococcus lactis TaxID=1358 RepID=UPI0003479DB8|nr:GNAT family N-acetyltransferase [Lactococcus lactis]KSU01931.1 Pai1 protein [Lactococcus lactis subsp. lactis]
MDIKNNLIKIIVYDEKYKADLLSMILEAKGSLGSNPSLNPDLLTISESYLKKGDKFWIAINNKNMVIGSIAYSSIPDSTEVFLHRFFIKSNLKHNGIGSTLLKFVEIYLKKEGKTRIKVHLGNPREKWIESYNFYPKYGYKFFEKDYLYKEL